MAMLNNVKLDHITSFGDAVFAFSITFIAISIQIPVLPDNLSELEVANRMLQLIPQFEIYFTSFVIIGIFWIKYHLIFNRIKDSQSIMLWLNLILLFFVTLISFGTSLQFENQYISTFVLYTLILTATSSLLSLIWIHATRYNLLKEDNMTNRQKKLYTIQGIIPTLIFASSIGIAFINLQLAQYMWVLIIPSQIFFKRKTQLN
ncbi:MAG TPA: TMEM175 family protein [Candidatus Nitrosocosmicus sp.]|jgi:TMEM175 potassium channel family protein|nr:TMEM175 family protein [Candidatus Nitrosocosmicus sp.]